MATIKTKLNDSYMNTYAIGTDLSKLVRDGVDTEAIYEYVYNRIVQYILQNNELLFDYNDLESALTGYVDSDGVKVPNAWKEFNAKYQQCYITDTDEYTEDTDYTEYRKQLFRNAQAKLLFEIVQGRLSKESSLDDIWLSSKEVDQILFDALYLYYKPQTARSL